MSDWLPRIAKRIDHAEGQWVRLIGQGDGVRQRVVVVDYQMGNLRSVQKAVERVAPAAEVRVSSIPEDIDAADKVILPGVGACGDAVRELRSRGLVDSLRRAMDRGRPFLGICLGLQMLFDVSYEGGEHAGLGILAGEVVRFPFSSVGGSGVGGEATGAALPADHATEQPMLPTAQPSASVGVGERHKVPHMGWNQVWEAAAGCPLMRGIEPGTYFYFVHSYFVQPQDASVVWLESEYGVRFCAAVWRDNLFATQFHPEKSQASGLKLLHNFMNL
ncbi:MAG: imidazole glycerol phosphate synthase subunit HisH [Pirellulaceae bacterium]|nr:MAG: imidazole glycerol phosphate synthase subunit HisH [Pirellulaceae bacterium]